MIVRYCLLLALAVSCSCDLAADAEKYLLPGNVVPIHYSLTIKTQIENFRVGQDQNFQFNGEVEILIAAVEDDVKNLVIHINDIQIEELSLKPANESLSELTITKGLYQQESNKQNLLVKPGLKKNEQYYLTIKYIGQNNNLLTAFYRSSYYQGVDRRWLLVTDFESFGARRAFPCFDEPKYKATFQLTSLINETLASQGYNTVFNSEIESITNTSDGYVKTTFQKTPLPLSTYLVAFIVSDFKSSPEPAFFNSSYAGENAQKPFSTIGRPKFFEPRQDLVSQVAGPAVLEFMTEKTKIGFGFNKVDQAGIPDFAAGAMENWGLVTYREALLFWNEQTDSSSQKQSVVTVTAHELGHQWFGDLVTLHWWSDLWLNEGFATFFEFHASDQIREPTLDTSSWDLIGQFVTDVVQSTALPYDSFSDARALTYEAYDQDTIDGFFDSISYEKGGSVIRMWRHILGEDIFYNGLSSYLKENAEKTGTPESLLSNLNKAAQSLDLPLSVDDLFKGWHLQAGYPLLTVTRNGSEVTISQRRHLIDDLPENANVSFKWNVPISYSTDLEINFNDTRPVAFLFDSDSTLTIELKNENATWIVLNNQAAGYYRINYDEENWDALIEAIEQPDSVIHEYNQAQIYDDLYTLSSFSKMDAPSIGKLLRLLKALKHQRSYVVWKSGLNIMNYLLTQLSSHQETYSLLKKYLSEIVAPVFEELGLNGNKKDEAHTQKLLRSGVAAIACRLGIESCTRQAAQLYDTKSIHPDVNSIVLCESMKNGQIDLSQYILENTGERNIFDIILDFEFCETPEIKHKNNLITDASFGDNNQAMMALKILKSRKMKNTTGTKRIFSQLGKILHSQEAEEMMRPMSKVIAKMIHANRDWIINKQPEILNWLKTNV